MRGAPRPGSDSVAATRKDETVPSYAFGALDRRVDIGSVGGQCRTLGRPGVVNVGHPEGRVAKWRHFPRRCPSLVLQIE